MSEKASDELLLLSGIQHFLFCRRQWALISIERQWQENVRTAEGRRIHERADDPFFTESRNGVIIARAVPVASTRLGLQGVCDVVEFMPAPDGARIFGREGTFSVAPIEYKRGRPKMDNVDLVQLCAQALCLEEMLMTEIPVGYMYYAEPRRRLEVPMTQALREQTCSLAAEMRAVFDRGITPKCKPSKKCQACSLIGICLPNMKTSSNTVEKYIQSYLSEASCESS